MCKTAFFVLDSGSQDRDFARNEREWRHFGGMISQRDHPLIVGLLQVRAKEANPWSLPQFRRSFPVVTVLSGGRLVNRVGARRSNAHMAGVVYTRGDGLYVGWRYQSSPGTWHRTGTGTGAGAYLRYCTGNREAGIFGAGCICSILIQAIRDRAC